MAASGLTLCDCRLPERSGRFDVRLAEGRIATIVAAGAPVIPPSAESRLSLDGRLLLPALADGHLHLDKSFIGLPWRPQRPGDTIAQRIAAERAERAEIGTSLGGRVQALLARVIGFGTLAVRSHVDIDEVVGLSHVETLLESRARLEGRLELQLVAFPQSGINPRVADLLDEALRLGVDVVGGLDPAGLDGDLEAHLDIVFGLAERHGRRIDIHLHDPGTLGTFQLRRIADRTKALGLQGWVAVSHAFALGMVDSTELQRTAHALAVGGVAIMTNGPGADAMPPLRALLAAGVTIFGGCDNIRDAWSPFGSGDLLQRAAMIAYRADFRSDPDLRVAFDLVTRHSRAVMGLPAVALAVGSPADLIAVHAADIPEAVAGTPVERIVIRAGQLLSAV